jgi:hypothetical protein
VSTSIEQFTPSAPVAGHAGPFGGTRNCRGDEGWDVFWLFFGMVYWNT